MKYRIALAVLANLAFCEAYVTCYYGSWSTHSSGNGHFDVEDIDPFLCDEVIYSYAGIDEETSEILVLDPYNDLYENLGKGGYERFTNLKEQNPDLKTTLSVGGWDEGSEKFSTMAGDSLRRLSFITSAMELLVVHNFDGLDIHWEFPTTRGGVPEDKANFVTLLEELRSALDEEGKSLTIAVSAEASVIDVAYDVPGIDPLVDRIHLMSYDFHGDWEKFTHHHSPLFPHPEDNEGNSTLNVDYAFYHWYQAGVTVSKVILGIPTYGRCFTLESELETAIYAPAPTPGRPGPYTADPGILGYNELCEFQSITNDWNVVHSPFLNEPYAYRLTTMIWCGYENPTSAALKASYAGLHGLGGVMIYTLGTDDFDGLCTDSSPYVLTNSIKESFTSSTMSPIGSTPEPTLPNTQETDPPVITTPETTAEPVVTDPPPPTCDTAGIYYLPAPNCNEYYLCSNGTPFLSQCPEGEYFNSETLLCDDPANVDTSQCNIPTDSD